VYPGSMECLGSLGRWGVSVMDGICGLGLCFHTCCDQLFVSDGWLKVLLLDVMLCSQFITNSTFDGRPLASVIVIDSCAHSHTSI